MLLLFYHSGKTAKWNIGQTYQKSFGLKTSMEKSKPEGEISRNLEASENRGYNSSASAPGTKYRWYYLLLKASRRGSIWFQWGLAFIPSSSWMELYSPGSTTHLPRWHNESVTLSRLDHKSLLASRVPRANRMTNREFSTSFCFDFKWILQPWIYWYLYFQGPKKSFFLIVLHFYHG